MLVGNDPSYLPITRFSIEQSDGVTVPSEFLAEATRDNFGVKRPIEVIPNFVDTERFRPDGAMSDVPLVRAQLELPSAQARRRRHRRLRARAPRRRGRGWRSSATGPSGRASKRRSASAASPPASTSSASVRDVAATLRRAHVFLLPSEIESFGLAALEALSCGVPVVASRTGGLPEVVREGEDGFLLPVGDIESMAAAVGRILDDAALHRRLAANARAGAVARFSRTPMIARYEAYYEKVLTDGRSA